MISQKQINTFQKEILVWYEKNKRDLPWRKTRDPYAILISEVMLQQTQVSRVIPKFTEWMEKFPTLKELSNATPRDVLLLWSGLGYNRRALYLHKLAIELVKSRNGVFSQQEEELYALPGIGEYTARALLCFAFDKQVAVIDTNVKKVIAVHFFNGNVPNKKVLEEVATILLPKGRAYEWNQALMDYAASVLKKEKIPIPKQSHFKTSNRFYRGQVIKLLLKNHSETVSSLFEKLENNGLSKEQFANILLQMEKDNMIVKNNTTISLPQ